MSAFARLLLASTALCPALLVYAAALYHSSPQLSGGLLCIALALFLLCRLILNLAESNLAKKSVTIKSAKHQSGEVLSLFLTYLLPAALTDEVTANPLAFLVFLVLVGIVIFQSDTAHINPLLAILGYNFYEVETNEGTTHTVLVKGHIKPGQLQFKRLSYRLLLGDSSL